MQTALPGGSRIVGPDERKSLHQGRRRPKGRLDHPRVMRAASDDDTMLDAERKASPPETMKGAVVSRAGAKLVKLGFAREILEKPGTPLWRRDEAGRSFALKLTAAGLKAIVVDEGPQEAISRRRAATSGRNGSIGT